MHRRHLLTLAAASAPLAACGFHPLYASRAPGAAAASLPAVYVDRISDRPGQLLRQALQRRLDGAGADTRRYELLVAIFYIQNEGTGLELDNSTTRQRLTGIADWSLKSFPDGAILTKGRARALDGFENTFEQYFAGQVANETATRRIAENVADRITEQVAAFFDSHKSA